MTKRSHVRPDGVTVSASIGKHLALAPVAFAVTEGPEHAVVYANALFRSLQAAGCVFIGPRGVSAQHATAADLTPLLDRALTNAETVRDAVIAPAGGGGARWSCSVWAVTESSDQRHRLVIAVRDVQAIEGAKERQRTIAQELLLSALREQDTARESDRAKNRGQYLAAASRDLSLSLDESTTRDTVRRLTLPRPGVWCIVDVVESNGALHRLAVIHPDPAKRALVKSLDAEWPTQGGRPANATGLWETQLPTVVTPDADSALLRAVHSESSLRTLREIGFGALLVIPLIVRARVQGAITFISRAGDQPFTPDEITLATDLGARCAMALDNARLYREADALRVAAQAANQSKSQFLGSMSHELRTPLNAIGGFTDLIEMEIEGPVTDEQRTALARIKANQQHLLKLITEILDFVRIESGRMEYHLGAVALNTALIDVAAMLSAAAEEKHLRFEGPICDADVMAWADPDRVRQIVVNLVMNAVKYTPANGGTIALACGVDGDNVVLHVTDTGPGMAADQLPSIFEPFVQLTAGLTDRRGGVGLGLPISRDLARAMGGNLTVESTVGAGSRFTLTLPKAPRQP
jgi:signal transduction histidine kinase